MDAEDDDILLGKRKARGVMYLDERVEIINPGEYSQMHNLPTDFFDDPEKRGQFVKNESKNIKGKDLEAYRSLNKDQLKKFISEVREIDNEIETNMWEEDICEKKDLRKIEGEIGGSKVLDDIKLRVDGREDIDRVRSSLEIMKARLLEKKQKLFC